MWSTVLLWMLSLPLLVTLVHRWLLPRAVPWLLSRLLHSRIAAGFTAGCEVELHVAQQLQMEWQWPWNWPVQAYKSVPDADAAAAASADVAKQRQQRPLVVRLVRPRLRIVLPTLESVAAKAEEVRRAQSLNPGAAFRSHAFAGSSSAHAHASASAGASASSSTSPDPFRSGLSHLRALCTLRGRSLSESHSVSSLLCNPVLWRLVRWLLTMVEVHVSDAILALECGERRIEVELEGIHFEGRRIDPSRPSSTAVAEEARDGPNSPSSPGASWPSGFGPKLAPPVPKDDPSVEAPLLSLPDADGIAGCNTLLGWLALQVRTDTLHVRWKPSTAALRAAGSDDAAISLPGSPELLAVLMPLRLTLQTPLVIPASPTLEAVAAATERTLSNLRVAIRSTGFALHLFACDLGELVRLAQTLECNARHSQHGALRQVARERAVAEARASLVASAPFLGGAGSGPLSSAPQDPLRSSVQLLCSKLKTHCPPQVRVELANIELHCADYTRDALAMEEIRAAAPAGTTPAAWAQSPDELRRRSNSGVYAAMSPLQRRRSGLVSHGSSPSTTRSPSRTWSGSGGAPATAYPHTKLSLQLDAVSLELLKTVHAAAVTSSPMDVSASASHAEIGLTLTFGPMQLTEAPQLAQAAASTRRAVPHSYEPTTLARVAPIKLLLRLHTGAIQALALAPPASAAAPAATAAAPSPSPASSASSSSCAAASISSSLAVPNTFNVSCDELRIRVTPSLVHFTEMALSGAFHSVHHPDDFPGATSGGGAGAWPSVAAAAALVHEGVSNVAAMHASSAHPLRAPSPPRAAALSPQLFSAQSLPALWHVLHSVSSTVDVKRLSLSIAARPSDADPLLCVSVQEAVMRWPQPIVIVVPPVTPGLTPSHAQASKIPTPRAPLQGTSMFASPTALAAEAPILCTLPTLSAELCVSGISVECRSPVDSRIVASLFSVASVRFALSMQCVQRAPLMQFAAPAVATTSRRRSSARPSQLQVPSTHHTAAVSTLTSPVVRRLSAYVSSTLSPATIAAINAAATATPSPAKSTVEATRMRRSVFPASSPPLAGDGAAGEWSLDLSVQFRSQTVTVQYVDWMHAVLQTLEAQYILPFPFVSFHLTQHAASSAPAASVSPSPEVLQSEDPATQQQLATALTPWDRLPFGRVEMRASVHVPRIVAALLVLHRSVNAPAAVGAAALCSIFSSSPATNFCTPQQRTTSTAAAAPPLSPMAIPNSPVSPRAMFSPLGRATSTGSTGDGGCGAPSFHVLTLQVQSIAFAPSLSWSRSAAVLGESWGTMLCVTGGGSSSSDGDPAASPAPCIRQIEVHTKHVDSCSAALKHVEQLVSKPLDSTTSTPNSAVAASPAGPTPGGGLFGSLASSAAASATLAVALLEIGAITFSIQPRPVSRFTRGASLLAPKVFMATRCQITHATIAWDTVQHASILMIQASVEQINRTVDRLRKLYLPPRRTKIAAKAKGSATGSAAAAPAPGSFAAQRRSSVTPADFVPPAPAPTAANPSSIMEETVGESVDDKDFLGKTSSSPSEEATKPTTHATASKRKSASASISDAPAAAASTAAGTEAESDGSAAASRRASMTDPRASFSGKGVAARPATDAEKGSASDRDSDSDSDGSSTRSRSSSSSSETSEDDPYSDGDSDAADLAALETDLFSISLGPLAIEATFLEWVEKAAGLSAYSYSFQQPPSASSSASGFQGSVPGSATTARTVRVVQRQTLTVFTERVGYNLPAPVPAQVGEVGEFATPCPYALPGEIGMTCVRMGRSEILSFSSARFGGRLSAPLTLQPDVALLVRHGHCHLDWDLEFGDALEAMLSRWKCLKNLKAKLWDAITVHESGAVAEKQAEAANTALPFPPAAGLDLSSLWLAAPGFIVTFGDDPIDVLDRAHRFEALSEKQQREEKALRKRFEHEQRFSGDEERPHPHTEASPAQRSRKHVSMESTPMTMPHRRGAREGTRRQHQASDSAEADASLAAADGDSASDSDSAEEEVHVERNSAPYHTPLKRTTAFMHSSGSATQPPIHVASAIFTPPPRGRSIAGTPQQQAPPSSARQRSVRHNSLLGSPSAVLFDVTERGEREKKDASDSPPTFGRIQSSPLRSPPRSALSTEPPRSKSTFSSRTAAVMAALASAAPSAVVESPSATFTRILDRAGVMAQCWLSSLAAQHDAASKCEFDPASPPGSDLSFAALMHMSCDLRLSLLLRPDLLDPWRLRKSVRDLDSAERVPYDFVQPPPSTTSIAKDAHANPPWASPLPASSASSSSPPQPPVPGPSGHFAELWGRMLVVDSTRMLVRLRDYPVPLLSAPRVKVSGLVIAGQLNCPEPFLRRRMMQLNPGLKRLRTHSGEANAARFASPLSSPVVIASASSLKARRSSSGSAGDASSGEVPLLVEEMLEAVVEEAEDVRTPADATAGGSLNDNLAPPSFDAIPAVEPHAQPTAAGPSDSQSAPLFVSSSAFDAEDDVASVEFVDTVALEYASSSRVPLKLYHDLSMDFTNVHLTYGPCLLYTLDSLSACASRLSSTPDPQAAEVGMPKLAWWDNLRCVVQGKLWIKMESMDMRLLTNLQPYIPSFVHVAAESFAIDFRSRRIGIKARDMVLSCVLHDSEWNPLSAGIVFLPGSKNPLLWKQYAQGRLAVIPAFVAKMELTWRNGLDEQHTHQHHTHSQSQAQGDQQHPPNPSAAATTAPAATPKPLWKSHHVHHEFMFAQSLRGPSVSVDPSVVTPSKHATAADLHPALIHTVFDRFVAQDLEMNVALRIDPPNYPCPWCPAGGGVAILGVAGAAASASAPPVGQPQAQSDETLLHIPYITARWWAVRWLQDVWALYSNPPSHLVPPLEFGSRSFGALLAKVQLSVVAHALRVELLQQAVMAGGLCHRNGMSGVGGLLACAGHLAFDAMYLAKDAPQPAPPGQRSLTMQEPACDVLQASAHILVPAQSHESNTAGGGSTEEDSDEAGESHAVPATPPAAATSSGSGYDLHQQGHGPNPPSPLEPAHSRSAALRKLSRMEVGNRRVRRVVEQDRRASLGDMLHQHRASDDHTQGDTGIINFVDRRGRFISPFDRPLDGKIALFLFSFRLLGIRGHYTDTRGTANPWTEPSVSEVHDLEREAYLLARELPFPMTVRLPPKDTQWAKWFNDLMQVYDEEDEEEDEARAREEEEARRIAAAAQTEAEAQATATTRRSVPSNLLGFGGAPRSTDGRSHSISAASSTPVRAGAVSLLRPRTNSLAVSSAVGSKPLGSPGASPMVSRRNSDLRRHRTRSVNELLDSMGAGMSKTTAEVLEMLRQPQPADATSLAASDDEAPAHLRISVQSEDSRRPSVIETQPVAAPTIGGLHPPSPARVGLPPSPRAAAFMLASAVGKLPSLRAHPNFSFTSNGSGSPGSGRSNDSIAWSPIHCEPSTPCSGAGFSTFGVTRGRSKPSPVLLDYTTCSFRNLVVNLRVVWSASIKKALTRWSDLIDEPHPSTLHIQMHGAGSASKIGDESSSSTLAGSELQVEAMTNGAGFQSAEHRGRSHTIEEHSTGLGPVAPGGRRSVGGAHGGHHASQSMLYSPAGPHTPGTPQSPLSLGFPVSTRLSRGSAGGGTGGALTPKISYDMDQLLREVDAHGTIEANDRVDNSDADADAAMLLLPPSGGAAAGSDPAHPGIHIHSSSSGLRRALTRREKLSEWLTLFELDLLRPQINFQNPASSSRLILSAARARLESQGLPALFDIGEQHIVGAPMDPAAMAGSSFTYNVTGPNGVAATNAHAHSHAMHMRTSSATVPSHSYTSSDSPVPLHQLARRSSGGVLPASGSSSATSSALNSPNSPQDSAARAALAAHHRFMRRTSSAASILDGPAPLTREQVVEPLYFEKKVFTTLRGAQSFVVPADVDLGGSLTWVGDSLVNAGEKATVQIAVPPGGPGAATAAAAAASAGPAPGESLPSEAPTLTTNASSSASGLAGYNTSYSASSDPGVAAPHEIHSATLHAPLPAGGTGGLVHSHSASFNDHGSHAPLTAHDLKAGHVFRGTVNAVPPAWSMSPARNTATSGSRSAPRSAMHSQAHSSRHGRRNVLRRIIHPTTLHYAKSQQQDLDAELTRRGLAVMDDTNGVLAWASEVASAQRHRSRTTSRSSREVQHAGGGALGASSRSPAMHVPGVDGEKRVLRDSIQLYLPRLEAHMDSSEYQTLISVVHSVLLSLGGDEKTEASAAEFDDAGNPAHPIPSMSSKADLERLQKIIEEALENADGPAVQATAASTAANQRGSATNVGGGGGKSKSTANTKASASASKVPPPSSSSSSLSTSSRSVMKSRVQYFLGNISWEMLRSTTGNTQPELSSSSSSSAAAKASAAAAAAAAAVQSGGLGFIASSLVGLSGDHQFNSDLSRAVQFQIKELNLKSLLLAAAGGVGGMGGGTAAERHHAQHYHHLIRPQPVQWAARDVKRDMMVMLRARVREPLGRYDESLHYVTAYEHFEVTFFPLVVCLPHDHALMLRDYFLPEMESNTSTHKQQKAEAEAKFTGAGSKQATQAQAADQGPSSANSTALTTRDKKNGVLLGSATDVPDASVRPLYNPKSSGASGANGGGLLHYGSTRNLHAGVDDLASDRGGGHQSLDSYASSKERASKLSERRKLIPTIKYFKYLRLNSMEFTFSFHHASHSLFTFENVHLNIHAFTKSKVVYLRGGGWNELFSSIEKHIVYSVISHGTDILVQKMGLGSTANYATTPGAAAASNGVHGANASDENGSSTLRLLTSGSGEEVHRNAASLLGSTAAASSAVAAEKLAAANAAAAPAAAAAANSCNRRVVAPPVPLSKQKPSLGSSFLGLFRKKTPAEEAAEAQRKADEKAAKDALRAQKRSEKERAKVLGAGAAAAATTLTPAPPQSYTGYDPTTSKPPSPPSSMLDAPPRTNGAAHSASGNTLAVPSAAVAHSASPIFTPPSRSIFDSGSNRSARSGSVGGLGTSSPAAAAAVVLPGWSSARAPSPVANSGKVGPELHHQHRRASSALSPPTPPSPNSPPFLTPLAFAASRAQLGDGAGASTADPHHLSPLSIPRHHKSQSTQA